MAGVLRRLRLALLCLAAASPAAAQPAAPAQTPLSLGEVVLLAEGPADVAAAALPQALRDADPRVRRVAGRVAGTGNYRALLGSVVGALVREQDAETGAELLRAALHLGAGNDRALLDRQAQRLGAPAVLVLAEWCARTQPADFVAGLETWVSQAGDRSRELVGLVKLAAARHPASRDDLIARWMNTAPPGGWSRLLDLNAVPASDRAIQTALESPRAFVREETVWFLVSELNVDAKVPAEPLDAAIASENPAASEWERFGRELIARRRKAIATPDRSQLLAAEGARRGARWSLHHFRELTDAERAAVFPDGAPEGLLSSSAGPQRAQPAGMRTAYVPADGALAAAVAAAGCKPPQESIGVATLAFIADGRPRRIELDVADLRPAACVKVMKALARLTIAEPTEGETDDATTTIAVPFHRSFVDCAATSAVSTGPGDGAWSQEIPIPHKTRDVKPFYPPAAQRRRIEGVVIMDALVTEKGCISRARVIRPIPLLDVAGLWAITQWQFEPSRKDGRAVSVAMTVTVNFRLR